MRALWAGDDASFKGEFVNFTGVSSNPKPPRGTVPIIVGGHSEAAAKRAGRLGDGFFPSIGTQVDILPLLDLVRRTAEASGRDPKSVELITGCPDASPKSGKDPRPAIEDRIRQGVGRIALPISAFMPNLEETLPRFGESVIRQYTA
jgi:hypothetical protein